MNAFSKPAIVVALLFVAGCAAAASPSPSNLHAEADVRVTHDIAMPHTEDDAGANPLNAQNIVGATTVFGTLDGHPFDKTYASFDGGSTWADTTPDFERFNATGDPRIIFTQRGTAIFVSLNLSILKTEVYRSTNGGRSWSGPVIFPFIDHELVAVDRTNGPHANRVYVVGERDQHTPNALPGMGGNRYIYVFTSDDDGRSFTRQPPAESGFGVSANSPFYRGGTGVEGVDVLSDGTVALSFSRYNPGRANYGENYVAISKDGAKTFQKQVLIFEPNRNAKSVRSEEPQNEREGNVTNAGQNMVLAADHSNGPFRDRLYSVWPERNSANLKRIMYSYSADRGKTWSAPRSIGSVDAREVQFQPMAAVNNRGALLVYWFSTAGFPRRDHFNVYAAASTNGGRSFAAPLRISSAPSYPRIAGNLLPVVGGKWAGGDDWEHEPGFISGYSRWSAGGDYIGLATTSDGIFHPYWPDSRGTEYEMYSARVHVGVGTSAPSTATTHDVSSDVVPAMDPLTINLVDNEIDVPVRLRNVSSRTLFGPISAAFSGIAPKKNAALDVEILNADSGGHGLGATFDYSNALGTYEALPPNSITKPIIWRFKLSDAGSLGAMTLKLHVTARY